MKDHIAFRYVRKWLGYISIKNISRCTCYFRYTSNNTAPERSAGHECRKYILPSDPASRHKRPERNQRKFLPINRYKYVKKQLIDSKNF
jgi:hypothetical protein